MSDAPTQPTGSPAPPDHKIGDIVNGHQLMAQSDGQLAWVPIPQGTPGVAPSAPSPKKPGLGLGKKIAIGAGALVLLIIIIGSINRPANNNDSPSADVNSLADVETEMVAVPTGLVGMTAEEASEALEAVGLKARYDGEPTAKVLSVSPATDEVAAGSTVTLTVEQPPALTLAQSNAVESADSYLRVLNFSRSGLIGQLEFEGYSTEDATFAADYLNPDWNAEAAGAAQSYLDAMAFSREGLYDQLIFEGYTPDQANAGLAAVGY